jgi:GT2 family glycosyltransferase
MKDLTIIICSYNSAGQAPECLSNLQQIRQNYPAKLDVIVKDQASQDGTPDLISQKFPWVKIIKGQNTGLSSAYNTAYHQSQSEYLLFLGMDAFPELRSLQGIAEYFDRNPDVGAATCKLILEDGTLDMDAHRAFPTPWISLCKLTGLNKLFPKSKTFNGYFLPHKDLNTPHEIDMCISHFMFTRKSLLDDIGGFDEDFFLYGEDVDICYRIKQAGYKIMYLPQWKAKHLKGVTVGIRATTRNIAKKPLKHRLKMQTLTTDAMRTFIKKHYKKKYPWPLPQLMILSARLLGKIRVFIESFR